MNKKRLAIFISGRGSNMEALLRACEAPDYPAEPILVLSNRPDARGLETAKARGIATKAIDHKLYDARQAFEEDIQKELVEKQIEFIALAGFMRVMTPWLVSKWEGRMVNIHPSLLPSFPGLHTHRRALDAGCRLAGCTVHYVTPGVDEGPVIGQASVPVMPDDTPDSLADRTLKAEHLLYPDCLEAAILGNQKRARVRLIDTDPESPILLSCP